VQKHLKVSVKTCDQPSETFTSKPKRDKGMNFSKFAVKHNALILICLIATSFGISIFYLHSEVSKIYRQDFFTYPANQYKLYLFLLKPLVVLLPFLFTITIVAIWLFLKARMKYIIIPSNDNINFDKTLLSENEKTVLEAILDKEGNMLQVDLKDTQLEPYTISRILGRFEEMGIIQRRRYGMTKMIQLLYEEQ